MKRIVQPLVQRWRQESPAVLAPAANGAEARRPFRLWMTGSLAVVMAAMLPLRAASEAERASSMKLLKHSRFGVTETLQRIELAALDGGLSVLARVPGAPPVLVLASSIGGTLAVMSRPDSRPAMPLSLFVRAASDGGADVLVASGSAGYGADHWADLPASVVADLRALPGMVDRALG